MESPSRACLEEAYGATFAGCAPADVFVAGHSLGGIFSQALVHGSSYAGLVLLGSYLSTVYGGVSWPWQFRSDSGARERNRHRRAP